VRNFVLNIALFLFSVVVFFGSEAHAQPTNIQEIRFIGISKIMARDLEGELPIVPGDFWKENLHGVIRSTLKKYYERRGFFHAKILSELSSNGRVLSIKIQEGEECKIRSIWVDDPPKITSKSVRERFKKRLERVLNIQVESRFDEIILADKLRELREWLVSENYILADTETVKMTFNESKTAVDLVLAVQYGEQITFGFQGNSIFTRGELNEFITQSRNIDLGRDFIGVITRKFKEEYRNRAHNHMDVKTRIQEIGGRKHVTFFITEGLRTRVEDLRWEGLSPENVELVQNTFAAGASRLVQRGYYVEKDFDKAVQIVLEELKSKGYLTAKLVAKNLQSPKFPERIRITLQISEGDQTLIGDVKYQGFKHFRQEDVEALLGVQVGQPFNPFLFEEGLQKIKNAYQAEGYLYFKFVGTDSEIVSFTENNRTANILTSVVEGPRIKIADVQVRGLSKTREYVVTREIEIQPDDWWLGSKIEVVEGNLKNLGLFSEVKIYPEPSARGPDYRSMIVDLKELEPGALETGPGFRSDLGVRAFARLSYNNIAGRNWIGILSAETNRRVNEDYRFLEYGADTSFIEPRFFGTRNLYLVGLSTKKQQFPPNFNAVSTTFTTGFERKMKPDLIFVNPLVTAKLIYRIERIRQFDVFVDGQQYPEDNRTLLIGSIIPSLSFDTRDNPFTTTKGILATASLEYSHPYLTNQKSYKNESHNEAPAYSKWTGSVHGYIPVTKDIVWSNVASAGFIRSNISDREIPLIKLFRLGGYSTIRGFKEDSINVDASSIKGTLTYLNFRTQFDLPLVGDLKFAPFLDAGNLYIDKLRGKPFFRAGAGAGLHYMTPIGPINFDWGYKIRRTGSETPGQFHFSVGLI